jgi:hypothetical protein
MEVYTSAHGAHIKLVSLILDLMSLYLVYFVKNILQRGEM